MTSDDREPRRRIRRGAARWLGAFALGAGCGSPATTPPDEPTTARERMVRLQLEARGIADPRVLAAMRKVPRHAFVPEEARVSAYADRPLPIGHGQTISQPYIVAAMSELARISRNASVLEVGTGSGYQAAILAELAREVRSIELIGPLAESARERLARMGYGNVHVRHGDGHAGWPEHAPYDAILVTAAPESVPPALLVQLAPGGRLVIPVGGSWQELEVHTRTEEGILVERIFSVRFVPMKSGASPAGPGEPLDVLER